MANVATPVSPSREDADLETVEIDAYVLDTLMADLVGHDRQPSAYLVYLFLWRRTDGGRAEASLSLRAIAEGTGLSKRAVQDALGRLVQRRLVAAARESIASTLTYTLHRPWLARTARLREPIDEGADVASAPNLP